LRDPFRLRLLGVFNPETEARAVPRKSRNIGKSFGVETMRISRMPPEHERSQRIANHRLVVNR